MKDIVTLFDRPDFKDEDEGMKSEVRELMGKVSRDSRFSFVDLLLRSWEKRGEEI